MLLFDYLHDVEPRPLIRLSGFNGDDVRRLHGFLVELSNGTRSALVLHEQPWVRAPGGCRLMLLTATRDRGICRSQAADTFEWLQTAGAWDNIAGLVEPFIEESLPGFQWLASTPGEADVLLSRTGEW